MTQKLDQRSKLRTAAKGSYDPPVVVASFARTELADELPQIITPHIHTSQSS
ncbi:hypothetical protein IU450_28450 [Nocardia abscessus]|uniref:hypothetical protein n=1 Tax=Nocardia abscessus TaxID=120957 RepID=UPI0018941E63|nr:hypothetical protein [Nocardia abscessus]MBF6339791.1 hypothetical protein [Nocardia abscessus]